MKILGICLLSTLLGCGGASVLSSGGSDRLELDDPVEPTTLLDSRGTPAIDIDRVAIESDGRDVIVVLYLEDSLAAYVKAVDEGGGLSSDPAWIYFDTDNDAATGGFAVPSELGGFEYEARVVSSMHDGALSSIYALDAFEQAETSFEMADRLSSMGFGMLEQRQAEWDRSKTRILVDGSIVTIRFPYRALASTSGDTIRIRLREHHRGPYTVDDFLADAVLELE